MSDSVKDKVVEITVEKEVTLAINKIVKEITGKGSQSCKVNQVGNLFIMQIRGFLSNGEMIMAKTISGCDEVKRYRAEIAKVLSLMVINKVNDLIGVKPQNLFMDINPAKNEGIIVLTFAEDISFLRR